MIYSYLILTIKLKQEMAKSRTMTNKQRDSFRVDIIDEFGDCKSHYFPTQKEADSFVKWKENFNKYKDFI